MSVLHFIRRDSFLDRLLERVPELEEVVSREKLAEQDAAAAAFRITRALFNVGAEPSLGGWTPTRDTVRRFLAFMEDVRASGAPDLVDAVAAVVGWLIWDFRAHQSVRDLLGPRLREAIREHLERDNGSLKTFLPFLRRVTDDVPGAARVVERTLEAWDGEIYSTYILDALSELMLDAKRRLLSGAGTGSEAEMVSRWLSLCEEAMDDAQLAELLEQTFVEDVAYSEISAAFTPQLPPRIRAAVDRWRDT